MATAIIQLTIPCSGEVMGKKGKQKKPPPSQKSKSGPKGKSGASEDPIPADDLDKDLEDLTLDGGEDEDADETLQDSLVQDKAARADQLTKQEVNGETKKSGVREVQSVDGGSDEEKPEGASSSASSVDVKDEKKMTRKELKKLKKKVKCNNSIMKS